MILEPPSSTPGRDKDVSTEVFVGNLLRNNFYLKYFLMSLVFLAMFCFEVNLLSHSSTLK